MKKFIGLIFTMLLFTFVKAQTYDFTITNGALKWDADKGISSGYVLKVKSLNSSTAYIYNFAGEKILRLDDSGTWLRHTLNGDTIETYQAFQDSLTAHGFGVTTTLNPTSQPIPFNQSVSMGMVNGMRVIDKFGIAPQGDTDTDIWEFGGTYIYDDTATAPIQYISSSSLADTGQIINIIGLDIIGNYTTQIAITDGQSVVNLSVPLWRVYRMQNVSDYGKDLAGILYCHTSPTTTNGVPPDITVRAVINNGNNQTLMALYTVPRGFVAFLYRGEIGVELEGNSGALAEYAHCHYESRRYGKIFTVKKAITCIIGGGSAVYQDVRSFPDVIPALTDIKLRAVERTQIMGLFGTFDILLVEESKFSIEYLQSIGQPGY